MNTLKIALAQWNFCVGDIPGNYQQIIQSLSALQQQNIDLVVFPELALCGYPPEDLLLRDQFHRACETALNDLRAHTDHTAILVGHPRLENQRCYNSASLLSKQDTRACYDKQTLPNYTVFDEKRYFQAGTSSCVVEIQGINIGILICEDIWESRPIQQAKQNGADVILCINASPFSHDKREIRMRLLKARTQETQLPILYVNLVGGQDELVFDGGSCAINSQGQVCQQAAYFENDTLIIEVEKKDNGIALKQHPIPPALTRHEYIYRALVLGVKEYIEKNGFPGAIVGLSGGIDSALTLAIAYDALGATPLSVLAMPSRYTADMSNNDAQIMANSLDIDFDIVSIEPIFASYLKAFEEKFHRYPKNVAEENIQARIRGNLLMALSNMSGKIVLTTGNKSELSVGYCTLYGDMAGGFAVLKDIPKTLVYELSQYRNSISPIIPQNIIDRPPSAELRDDQVDQDSLPPYDILDQIIELYIHQDQSAEQIIATGIDEQTVLHVIKLIMRNEYKRRQAPVGIRISERAFGRDRRYPITSKFK